MKLKYSFTLMILVLACGYLRAQNSTTPEAQSVMNTAYKKAKKENKKVILIFHASWCGWCHKMDSSLNDISCKVFFDKNYIIEHLTVQESKGKENLENPGAEDLMQSFNGKNQGLPYWVVLDNKGTFLFDSQIRITGKDGAIKGSNIGCPASTEEVKAFIDILKQTSVLTDTELEIIAKRFAKNKA